MPIYKCETCAFETSLKGNYKQHMNTKKHKKLTARKLKENNLTPKDSFETPKDSLTLNDSLTPNDSFETPNEFVNKYITI